MLSMNTYDEDIERCPALIFEKERFWCQLVLDDEAVKEALAIEAGCSSNLFNTQREAFLAGAGKAYLTKLAEQDCWDPMTEQKFEED